MNDNIEADTSIISYQKSGGSENPSPGDINHDTIHNVHRVSENVTDCSSMENLGQDKYVRN